MKDETFKCNEFGSALSKVEGLEPDEIFITVRDKIKLSSEERLTLKDINAIAAMVSEENDFGLILYYGG